MDKRYKHLNGEERGMILAEHRRGASLGAIGALPGSRVSTIGQELGRGRPEGDPAHMLRATWSETNIRRAASGADDVARWPLAAGFRTLCGAS